MLLSDKVRFTALLLIFLSLAQLVPAQDQNYRILAGDTFYSIARRFNIDVKALQEYNSPIDPSKIRIGQLLKIPSQAHSSSVGSTSSTTVGAQATIIGTKDYRIVRGDTWYGIARQHNLSVETLTQVNGTNTRSVLRIGQSIKIPQSSSTQAIASVTSTTIMSVTGTSLDLNDYRGKQNVSWPTEGERFTMGGKLPGVLIKATVGQSVRSVNEGRVSYSGPHSSLGHVVIVQNSLGFNYIYGGNDSSSISKGQLIHIGDEIGKVGITPGLKEPRVYFSVWKNGKYLDPGNAPR